MFGEWCLWFWHCPYVSVNLAFFFSPLMNVLQMKKLMGMYRCRKYPYFSNKLGVSVCPHPLPLPLENSFWKFKFWLILSFGFLGFWDPLPCEISKFLEVYTFWTAKEMKETNELACALKSSVEVSLTILVYQLPDIKAGEFDPESRELNF